MACALLAFFNQMVFVQSRIAMLDIFALAFGLFAIAAFMHGFRRRRPQRLVRVSPGWRSVLSIACKWSGLFALATCIVIIAVIRLMQGWRTQFADGNANDWYRPDLWPDFRSSHFAACFVLDSGASSISRPSFRSMDCRFPTSWKRSAGSFGDNTTTAIAGHTYMSAWPSWPFLVRPVWYLFDKIGDDRIAAIVLLGNPLVLWPALPALAVCLRDWIVTRRADAFLILSFYLGPYLAWALLPRTLGFLYYYLPSATFASLALVYAAAAGQQPALAVMGLCRARFRGLCGDAADLGGVCGNVDGDVQPADDFPELDLSWLGHPPAVGASGQFRKSSLRRGLGVHVDDLNAAVDRVHRRVRILGLVLAIADGDEIGAGDAVIVDQDNA